MSKKKMKRTITFEVARVMESDISYGTLASVASKFSELYAKYPNAQISKETDCGHGWEEVYYRLTDTRDETDQEERDREAQEQVQKQHAYEQTKNRYEALRKELEALEGKK